MTEESGLIQSRGVVVGKDCGLEDMGFSPRAGTICVTSGE